MSSLYNKESNFKKGGEDMLDQFFKNPKIIQKMYEGPTGPYINNYVKLLHEGGYSQQSSRYQLRLIASFSSWLQQQEIEIKNINNEIIEKFLEYRRQFVKIRSDDKFVLKRLLNMLHEMGITDNKVPEALKTDYQKVEDDFKHYLLHERGLTLATVKNYLPIVHKFISERFDSGPIQFVELSASDITNYVKRHACNLNNKCAKLMVTAIRVFLRYLLHRREINTDLSTCVPTVACWKLSTLPKYLQPEQVQTILRHCNRQSPLGKRNYAILLLLARLGLRACEVIALKLDDIEWETGHITICGKGGKTTRFPLPQDVGDSIADYLINGRPSCLTRHVFVCHHAPITKFSHSSTISSIVKRAIEYSGINSPLKGAHLFRHTLATQMLREGASLAEVGDILRHKNPNTTLIYAKLDITALKTLVQPWPGGDI